MEKLTLVIGSTVVDVIIKVPALPRTGEDVNFSSQELHIGGCAHNVSDVLRHFGVPYRICSPIGTGMYGDFIKDFFSRKGIPVFAESEEENSCCYCFVNTQGERTFICGHGAEYKFDRKSYNKIDMAQVDSAYICGLELGEHTGADEIAYAEELAAFHAVRGTPFTLYFAPGPRVRAIPQLFMERMFKIRPVVHLNVHESLAFTRETTAKAAAHSLWSRTHNSVVITMGAEGALYVDGETGTADFAAAEKAHVVDTIGAGDAHCGALIAALRMGKPLGEAVALANKVAAASVGVSGATLGDAEFARLAL